MTVFQKWILIIAFLIVSFAFAYYLLVYIPVSKKADIRMKAGIECAKRREDLVKTFAPAQTEEQLRRQVEIVLMGESSEIRERCIKKVLSEWGY